MTASLTSARRGGRAGPARPAPRPRSPPVGLHLGREGRTRSTRRSGPGGGERRTSRSRRHDGAHPRLGRARCRARSSPTAPAARAETTSPGAAALRDDFAALAGPTLGCAELSLRTPARRPDPDIPRLRRHAFAAAADPGRLVPDFGPLHADPRTGRPWSGRSRVPGGLQRVGSSAEVARRVAPLVRRPEVAGPRALASAGGPRSRATWSTPTATDPTGSTTR